MLFVYRKQSNERIHIRRMWAPRVGNFHNPSSSVVKTRHVLFDVQQVCLLLKIVAISQNARSVWRGWRVDCGPFGYVLLSSLYNVLDPSSTWANWHVNHITAQTLHFQTLIFFNLSYWSFGVLKMSILSLGCKILSQHTFLLHFRSIIVTKLPNVLLVRD